MTPREFLNAIVKPNVAEFHDNYEDMRRAFNAVAAVDALAAHLYVWAKANAIASPAVSSSGDDTVYRATLAARDSDFALLRDVAKAQKHVHLTRGTPQVIRSDQISTREIGFGEGGFGEGRYGGPQQVVVDTQPGEFSYIETVVNNSLAFLEAEMTSLGA
jgi:hypothetical protein